MRKPSNQAKNSAFTPHYRMTIAMLGSAVLAGYKVLRYEDVPEYHELREAFGQSSSSYADLDDLDTALKKYDFLAHSVRHKVKVLG